MPYALTYIRIVLLGVVPSFLYNMGSGVLRAVGDTRRPVYFLIIACLTNIVLDFVLVAGGASEFSEPPAPPSPPRRSARR